MYMPLHFKNCRDGDRARRHLAALTGVDMDGAIACMCHCTCKKLRTWDRTRGVLASLTDVYIRGAISHICHCSLKIIGTGVDPEAIGQLSRLSKCEVPLHLDAIAMGVLTDARLTTQDKHITCQAYIFSRYLTRLTLLSPANIPTTEVQNKGDSIFI